MSDQVLVSGAGGHLGRRVVELLLEAGTRGVVAGTRDPAKLADLAARGVEVRRLDFDDPASLAAGFAGIGRALIVSTDALDRPGRRLEQHRRAVEAAARAGVRHLVYTSLTNPGPESAVLIAPDHRDTEAAIAATDLGFTVLRNNLYIDLVLGSLAQTVANGALYTARAAGAVGYVTREDCARTAAAALVDRFEGRRTLDVTGPAAVTGDELAAAIAVVAGKPVAHVPLPPSGYREALIGAGLPAGIADLLVSFEVASARGELDVVSSAVRDLTGRPPSSVAAFLAAQVPIT